MKLSNRQRSHTHRIELSMTSMIDVVFLLLIFFLVTTTFIAPERQLKSNIKTQQQSANPDPVDLEPAVIDITMAGDQPVYRLGAIETQDLAELDPVLKSFPNKHNGAFVRAADRVPFESPVLAVNACRNAGFSSITYIPLTGNARLP